MKISAPTLSLISVIVVLPMLCAQVAAPPTVDLDARKTQQTVPSPSPSPTPTPAIPEIPEISQLDKVFKDTSIGQQGDALRVHVEWRRLRNQVTNDPEVVAARDAAQRATTDLEKRKRLRHYYDVYYGRMEALAPTPELKAGLDSQKVAHATLTKQPKVRHETDGTPTPPPGTTPTPTPKGKKGGKKKQHHGLFGGQ